MTSSNAAEPSTPVARLDTPQWEGFDAVVEAVWRWERFACATTPTTQAAALVELSNAMSDLASWAPRCCEEGYFGQDHHCMKSPGEAPRG